MKIFTLMVFAKSDLLFNKGIAQSSLHSQYFIDKRKWCIKRVRNRLQAGSQRSCRAATRMLLCSLSASMWLFSGALKAVANLTKNKQWSLPVMLWKIKWFKAPNISWINNQNNIPLSLKNLNEWPCTFIVYISCCLWFKASWCKFCKVLIFYLVCELRLF